MSDITLRPALAIDHALLASLHARSWQHAYAGLLPAGFLRDELDGFMAAKWAARLAEPAGTYCIAIAEVDGVAAGFVCLWPQAEPDKGVYLDNLHVLPAFQGLGLGRRLMAWAAAETQQGWPQQPMFLYVLAGNGGARAVYQRMGGFETIHQDVPMPGNVTLPVMQVTWQDVPGLQALLQQQG
jgi:ribosomal protein S18 acetylase RimI-like enzyme